MNVKNLTGRILVDTNVLIYATLSGDHRHRAATEVLDLRRKEGVALHVSVQNLAEMYPNLTGPKNQSPDSPEVAREKIRSVARLMGVTVLPVTMETVHRALKLCENCAVRRQTYFDMQLVALMQETGIGTIITENIEDFKSVQGIRAVNPFRRR